MNLWVRQMLSPVGELRLVANEAGLTAVLWATDGPERVKLPEAAGEAVEHPVLSQAETELHEYFAGARTGFTVPLAMQGTAFQKAVWEALRAIPYGEQRTYGQIAAKLGDLKATRAVGAANGRNPLSIVVPCHRVLGASGKLTGFAGGLAAKAYLLQLEQRFTPFALVAGG